MPMRYPLGDLPLEFFISEEHRASSKRPLSPTVLLSPSKRRILSAEGLYSPEKKRKHTPSRRLFSESAPSASGPARKLDFTASSHPAHISPQRMRDASIRPETPPSRHDKEPRLAPSPEITSGSTSDASTSVTQRESIIDSPRYTLPIRIPREIPEFADRQSVHWPGFQVHADTHITILSSLYSILPSEIADVSDLNDSKENIRPRRRIKKVAADEGNGGRTPKTNRSERHTDDFNIMSILTHSRGSQNLTPDERQIERKKARFVMIHEQDEEMNEEVDVEQQL